MLLDHIKQSSDIKELKEDQYPELAREIRQFLIEKISKTGGHLASNLGVVELTMALHLAFDLPKDKIVWDVGHQAYTHKLLSGRKAGFDDLRQFGGMSGFPKRKESPCLRHRTQLHLHLCGSWTCPGERDHRGRLFGDLGHRRRCPDRRNGI